MGCCSSLSAGHDAALASGPGAKRFFYLDDLPLSICASPSGVAHLQLRLVGPSGCLSDAMWRLEDACEHRGLLIQSAQMSREGGLIHWVIELKGIRGKLDAFQMSSPMKMLPFASNPANGLELKLRRAGPEPGPEPLPEWVAVGVQGLGDAGDGCLAAVPEILCASATSASYVVGCHAALLQAVGRAEASVIAAKLETNGVFLEDELWVQPVRANAQEVDDLAAEMKQSYECALYERNFPAYLRREDTPKKFLAAKDASGLVGAMRENDAHKLASQAGTMPPELYGLLSGLRYEMRPCTEGFKICGFDKFIGAGWIPVEAEVLPQEQRSAEALAELPPVLEIRTHFSRASGGAGGARRAPRSGMAPLDSLQRWAASGKGHAEFVTWLDAPSKTWTIWKVFLNGVLPEGMKCGAQAVAEHLSGDAGLFFGETPGVRSNLFGAIADLRCIKVCDVVNWNTYVLMAIAASADRSPQMFGSHMASTIEQELAAAKLGAADLESGSVTTVFTKTGLGRLVCNVLSIWNAQLGLSLYVEEAAVSFVRGALEHICGEAREMMHVRVSIGRATPHNSFARATSCP